MPWKKYDTKWYTTSTPGKLYTANGLLIFIIKKSIFRKVFVEPLDFKLYSST